MWFVYILRGISDSFIYIGHTDDLVRRLGQHNDGLNQSTKHYAPFVIEAYVAVKTEAKSIELEK